MDGVEKELKFVFIKWFPDEPVTGGEKEFLAVFEILRKYYNVSLVECFPIKARRERKYLYNVLARPLEIICRNRLSLKLVKNGYEVYSDSRAGTIEIIQPPPLHSLSLVVRLVHKYHSFFDLVSRMGRNNLKMVIYVSQFVKNNCKVEKDGLKEYTIYPINLKSLPEDVRFSEKEDIIVTVARISPEKKLERLQEILKDLKYKHYLIGFETDTKYTKKIERMLPNTQIIINATEKEKNIILKKAKIFINTSENESAAMTLVEALAYGVVPLAHDSGGSLELLPEDFLYNDNKEAREKIEKFMKNYNDEVFSSLRRDASKFLTDELEKSLLYAFNETFGKTIKYEE